MCSSGTFFPAIKTHKAVRENLTGLGSSHQSGLKTALDAIYTPHLSPPLILITNQLIFLYFSHSNPREMGFDLVTHHPSSGQRLSHLS